MAYSALRIQLTTDDLLLATRYSHIRAAGRANKNALIPIGTSGAEIAGIVVPPKVRGALTGIASAVRNIWVA
jgi:hypothetical protein